MGEGNDQYTMESVGEYLNFKQRESRLFRKKEGRSLLAKFEELGDRQILARFGDIANW